MNVDGRIYIRRLLGDSVVYGIPGSVARFAGLFLIPIYTRIFSPGDYGIIALISCMTLLLSVFVVLGLDSASVLWFYETDDTKHRKSTIASWFWCQLAVSSAAAGTLVVLAPRAASLLTGSEEHASLIRLGVMAIPLMTFPRVLGNWLRYQRRPWAMSVFSTVRLLGIIGLIILFVVVWGWGLKGIYVGTLIGTGLMATVAVALLRSWVMPWHFSWPILKSMLRYGLPMVPASIALWIRQSSDRLIIQLFWEKSEVGLYAIGASLASGVALVTEAFQMAWAPFAFSILHERNSTKVYARVLTLYAWLGCFLCTGVSVFASDLLKVLTTERYYSAASCVPFLSFSVLVIGAHHIAGLRSGLVKRSKPYATSIMIGACGSLLFNLLIVPHFGRDGAAIGNIASCAVGVVYLFIVSQRNYYIPYKFGEVLMCLGFSWVLITVDRVFIPANGLVAFCCRLVLCSLFVPLGFLLGILKPSQTVRRLRQAVWVPFGRSKRQSVK